MRFGPEVTHMGKAGSRSAGAAPRGRTERSIAPHAAIPPPAERATLPRIVTPERETVLFESGLGLREKNPPPSPARYLSGRVCEKTARHRTFRKQRLVNSIGRGVMLCCTICATERA